MSGSAAQGRPPLPDDPALLPPLGPDFDAAVARAADVCGLELGPGQRAAIEAHARLLVAWNVHLNLTALRTPRQVAVGHVADSLTAVPVLERLAGKGAALVDLGSGGGYPGLALAAAWPWRRVDLIESVGKKARFLAVAGAAVVDSLGTANEPAPAIAVRGIRVEALGHDPSERASWDVATVRALGSLAEVVELGLPLLRTGGLLIAWKQDRPGTSGLASELAEADPIVAAVGGARPTVERALGDTAPAGLAELNDHRLVLVRKARATPARFPRSPSERHRLLR